VERIPPHTLRIRVFERQPIAQINVARPGADGIELAVFQIDAEGCVMLPLARHQRSLSTAPSAEALPLLGGLNPNEVQPGRRIKTPQLAAALLLLVSFDRSPMAGLVDLKRVDLSSPEVLTVTTGQGAEITLGLGDIERQLRRWRQIYDRGQKENKVIATLDLAVTNNIPARWQDASTVPPGAPKLPKPLRTKQKHV
jgi:hypothetical protein